MALEDIESNTSLSVAAVDQASTQALVSTDPPPHPRLQASSTGEMLTRPSPSSAHR